MALLIRETIEDVSVEILQEATNTPKNYFLNGMFMQAETVNRNGRMYPKHILENELNRYQPLIAGKRTAACGELGHPDTPSINLDRVSHRITDLKFEGNAVTGRAKVMDTPYGNIVKNFIDEGVILGMSTRGMGSIKNIGGSDRVQDDFRLATIDIVSDPSGPECFVNGIYENTEWVFMNGVWTHQQAEQARKVLVEANKSDLEIIALNIWSGFLQNIIL